MNILQLNFLSIEQLTSVIELDRLCFGGLWTCSAYQRELDSPNSDLLVLSSPKFFNSVLGLGCLWAILDEAHITILAVHPDYQRQGLGQALLIALLTAAVHRGLERATLEVRASNHSAVSLYDKFGFKLAGRRKGYYQDTGEDALILWLGDLNKPGFAATLANWQTKTRDRLSVAGWDLPPLFVNNLVCKARDCQP